MQAPSNPYGWLILVLLLLLSAFFSAAEAALLAMTQYLHDVREVYVFLLVTYFVCSYTMSHASRKLEQRFGLGER